MEIILASQSPRRKQLLENIGVNCLQIDSGVKEVLDLQKAPAINAMALAFEKARAVGRKYPEKIVIAADTIVVKDNQILEKPKDTKEAFEMLQQLNGSKHSVITGFAVVLFNENKKTVDFVNTSVYFGSHSMAAYKRYIATKEPLDKAGGYGIQGKGGLLVDRINGDYSNVVGLPLARLNEILEQQFNVSLI